MRTALLSKSLWTNEPLRYLYVYCSKDKDLTIAEVVDKTSTKMPYFSTAIFKNKKVLRLVDFTKLPEVPSIFDEILNEERETIFFLKQFIEDISRPVDSSDSIIEYIPTQIITEYIKFNDKLNLDGMIYTSSKIPGAKNIVLFFNHEESLDNLSFSPSSIVTVKI
ncbi:RES family NAD+ phosphorylase [Nodularia spumigena CS-584]|uniref:RES family NAD+ phosphorylase n=1 Tax=Nodularia spumigena TaxID=70799 RepID=UPI00232FF0E9|nr:RES family NAD+ phosphorylase [Nodularia spumigena]MDB9382282.1 RES family NAD+ phosphorylase [Nodularia spumigena CS-584]